MEENPLKNDNYMVPNLALLKTLCILTFVGSGLGCISYGIIGLMHDFFAQNTRLIPDEQNRELITVMLSAGRPFFAITSLLYAISFAGALWMWRLRKPGFHMYAASQLLLLIIPMAMIKEFPMPGLTILITIAFIWMYSRFLKVMT